ncbi:MAG: hypothetical protein BGO77_07225 [Caedibacter sp. 37-49]|nr:MAG: hypothetical protein BGO77_07225 [Caedibacter sp. 37-49]
MSEDFGHDAGKDLWQASTLLKRFHGTRVGEESKSLIVIRVLETDDRFLWLVVGRVKEDKGEVRLPIQRLLFHFLIGEK